MKILITGTAGFIGFHLVNRLVSENYDIVGLDNINDYYDANLKYARLNETGINKYNIEYGKDVQSEKYDNYRFIKLDLTDEKNIFELFKNERFDSVVNLAAQAGVRYSLKNPKTYIDSNIYGFLNILEACRHYPVKHLLYASSSSVYGANTKIPFSESDPVEKPISLYAATKRSNELMAFSYHSLYNIPSTGLRFFTVYGPWGRPDMAYYKFTKAILENKPIDVYNKGRMSRDLTYIDDNIEALRLLLFNSQKKQSDTLPFILNLGNNSPTKLKDFINIIETKLEKKAICNYIEMQPGDMNETWADVSDMITITEYVPKTKIEEGISKFVDWFVEYNKIQMLTI
ncbi:MAG: NAD-dependent epimerase/dehydratase family protein [Bacteroidetes bacterium]|nr:NAD-dependent epimerase/dehydratase family protein [Bacteroidota bacterium]